MLQSPQNYSCFTIENNYDVLNCFDDKNKKVYKIIFNESHYIRYKLSHNKWVRMNNNDNSYNTVDFPCKINNDYVFKNKLLNKYKYLIIKSFDNKYDIDLTDLIFNSIYGKLYSLGIPLFSQKLFEMRYYYELDFLYFFEENSSLLKTIQLNKYQFSKLKEIINNQFTLNTEGTINLFIDICYLLKDKNNISNDNFDKILSFFCKKENVYNEYKDNVLKEISCSFKSIDINVHNTLYNRVNIKYYINFLDFLLHYIGSIHDDNKHQYSQWLKERKYKYIKTKTSFEVFSLLFLTYYDLLIKNDFPKKYSLIPESFEKLNNCIYDLNIIINKDIFNNSKVWQKNKIFDFSDENYSIISPNNIEDIINEGKALHNCLISYTNEIIKEKVIVLFIRKNEDINKPFFCLEIYNKKLTQIKGFANKTNISLNMKIFLNKFVKEKNKYF